MELTHRPGNLMCVEVRELLSDVIDARRGEIPHPEGTVLAQSGMKAAVELHLAGCGPCRDELAAMEAIGAVFAEYNVGEPSAQVFADYPRIVRERLKREPRDANVIDVKFAPVSRWRRRIFSGAAAGIAAAVAFTVSSHYFHAARTEPVPLASNHRPLRTLTARDVAGKTPVRIRVPHGNGNLVQFADLDTEVSRNPDQPTVMKEIDDVQDEAGYLVLGERTGSDRPLLGAFLKVSRDASAEEKSPGGVVVYDVLEGSPAEAMGLRKGDHIIQINDLPVENGAASDAVAFLSAVHLLGTGADVQITVLRRTGSQWVYRKPFEGVLGQY